MKWIIAKFSKEELKIIGQNLYYLNKKAKELRDIRQDIKDSIYNINKIDDKTVDFLKNNGLKINNKSFIDDDGTLYVVDQFDKTYQSKEEIKEEIKENERELYFNQIKIKEGDDSEDENGLTPEENIEYYEEIITELEQLAEILEFNTNIKHNLMSDILVQIDNLYTIKDKVINFLKLQPVTYHKFDDDSVRPMYKIDEYEFHNKPLTKEQENNLEKIEEIEGLISSENILATDIKDINEAVNNLENILNTKLDYEKYINF